jgi:hypothetical protein
LDCGSTAISWLAHFVSIVERVLSSLANDPIAELQIHSDQIQVGADFRTISIRLSANYSTILSFLIDIAGCWFWMYAACFGPSFKVWWPSEAPHNEDPWRHPTLTANNDRAACVQWHDCVWFLLGQVYIVVCNRRRPLEVTRDTLCTCEW